MDVRRRRPTLLVSPAARRCEAALGGPAAGAAARGLLCHLASGGEDGLDHAAEAIAQLPVPGRCVLTVEGAQWQRALDHPRLHPAAAVIRAELPRDRALAALAVRDLRRRGLPVRVASRPLGWSAARRALAGIRFGGAEEARLRRWAALLLGAAEPAAAARRGRPPRYSPVR